MSAMTTYPRHDTGVYAFGGGCCKHMKPTQDGTHRFTAGDFRYDSAGEIANSATDVTPAGITMI